MLTSIYRPLSCRFHSIFDRLGQCITPGHVTTIEIFIQELVNLSVGTCKSIYISIIKSIGDVEYTFGW